MSQGKRFGKAKPAADTWTTLYTVPTGLYIQYELSAANVGESDEDTFIFAVTTESVPADEDILIPNEVLKENAFIQYTQKAASADDKLMVKSTNGNIAFSASGYEANIPAVT